MTSTPRAEGRSLARLALCSFLAVFIAARVLVILIMTRAIPDLFLHLGGTHVHHLNYGIFLLSALGGYLLFARPSLRGLRIAALAYGAGMALTYDEFGMWLHLGGSYWQRASWDAVGTVAALLALLAFAPSFARLRPRHWITGAAAVLTVTGFIALLWWTVPMVEAALGPRLEGIESQGPP